MSKRRTPSVTGSTRDLPPPGRLFIRTSANLADPPLWPTGHAAMTFTEKVNKLATLAPAQINALHAVIDSLLREAWWATARTDDGLALLAHLVEADRP